ncbi:PstS family phosphate ABC transporter substrate-binding protein [Hymenobacter defluvii]|nr:substrate-binding domain-containing protein [Hymenobacter defluvii]
MMRASRWVLGGIVALAGLAASCNRPNEKGELEVNDTPTSGKLTISVDETFQPIMKAETDTFQELYQYAKITSSYKPEQDAVEDLLANRSRVVVLSRELTADERATLNKDKIVPEVVRVGTDGLAIILHPSNLDTLLTMDQLRDIFTGKTTRWDQISGKKTLSDINVVFDANRSSTTRFVQDSITRGAALTSKIYASKSNPALIDYVASHPNAIGVIGANWISDRDDKTVENFLDKIRVAAIAPKASANPDDYLQPYQAYLALKTYPLRRNLYVISRDARTGLGKGLVAFVAGSKGQLIILKSGLVPAIGQTRIVNTAAQ